MLNNRKKILFVGHLPPPYGGIAIVMKNLLESPLKEEYDLIELDISRKKPREKLNTNILMKIIKFDYFYNFKWYYKLVKVLSTSPIDIVHIQGSNSAFPRDVVFCVISKLFRKKVVFHFHGGAYLKFWMFSWSYAKYFIPPCLLFMDAIIFLSRGLSLPFEGLIKKEKIHVVPHFVNFTRNNNGKQENSSPVVLFLGRLTREKGIYVLLDAIEKVRLTNKKIKFVLAGSAETEQAETRLKQLCEIKNSSENIDFAGLIFGEAKKKVLEKSDIFVLPSYTEVFPVAIIEAMAFGLPVIATKVGAIAEIVTQDENGLLIDVSDSDALANSLLLLIENPELRKKMSFNNINKSQALYSPEVVSKKWSALYNQL